MKIAHCLPDQNWIEEMRGENPKNAAHIQQKYIAKGLHSRGHDITWIAPNGSDHVSCAAYLGEPKPVRQTWTLSRWFKLSSGVIWKLQQALGIPYLNIFSNLRRYDACLQCLPGHDIVFERNGLYNAGVAMAARKLELPYFMFFDADQIAELDFIGEPLKGLLRWRANALLRFNLDTAHRIICVSKPAKQRLIDVWNVPEDRIAILPNAVDVERFKPDSKLALETRASLQLTDCPLIVFVGSFYQWHDVETLLRSFAIVLKTHEEAVLLLLGDGTERKKMMQVADELRIGHAVRFTGFVNYADVVRYVNAADVAVVPVPKMDQELWLSPMKLFEYMASGKAVVASAMGQIKDVIRDGENGLLVPPGDPPAMATALSKLIANMDLRSQIGTQARKDAVNIHSWENYLTRLEEVFTSSKSLASS